MRTCGSAPVVAEDWQALRESLPVHEVTDRQDAGSSQYHSKTFHMLLTTKGFGL